jgi:Ca-activated chloride channel family protein
MHNPETYRHKYLKFAIVSSVISVVLVLGVLSFLGVFSQSTERLNFANPSAIWGLLFYPLFFVVGYFWMERYDQLTGKYVRKNSTFFLTRFSVNKFGLKMLLLQWVFVCLFFALSDPHYGHQKVKAYVKKTEIVVALDVSNSMNCMDISKDASRLEVAKRALIEFANKLNGEKIGLCIFAGGAYVQLPLTADYNTAKLFFNDVQSDLISNQGTNINQALITASSMFSKERTTKVVLLITDGENHEEAPEEAYELLKDKKIQLAVMGIGTKKGGPIPVNYQRPELGSKTSNGMTVITKVDPALIQEIANETGAYAKMTSNAFPKIEDYLVKIEEMKDKQSTEVSFETQKQVYVYPMILGLLFYLLYISINFWFKWIEHEK